MKLVTFQSNGNNGYSMYFVDADGFWSEKMLITDQEYLAIVGGCGTLDVQSAPELNASKLISLAKKIKGDRSVEEAGNAQECSALSSYKVVTHHNGRIEKTETLLQKTIHYLIA